MSHVSRKSLYTAVLAVFSGAAAGLAQNHAPTPVGVTQVVQRQVPASMRLVGTVLPQRSSVVAAEVGGPIIEFDRREGDYLRRGDVICRIDPMVSRMWVDEAAARLDSLEARLAELEAGERIEELQRLEAAEAEATAMLEKWTFERDRVRSLFGREQANAKEVHDAEMERLAAERRLSQSRAELEKARNGPRPEEIARAKHDVAAQRAVLERLQHNLERTEIRAPFDGFIVSRSTEVGEWIEPGGPVCQMVDLETVKVRVDVPESAITFAQPGQAATVEIEALKSIHSAPITRVIPRATASSRTFPIDIDLPNAEHIILPGMFVWAVVPSGPSAERLMVDKDAIVARGLVKQLFVVRPAPEGGVQMAIPLDLTTGLEVGNMIEVQAEGLSAGDLVVSRANERLFGPTPVVPVPVGSEPPPESAATLPPPAPAASADGESGGREHSGSH